MAEVLARRTRYQKVFTEDDRHFTAEVHAGPIHFLHKDTDQWTDIADLFDQNGNSLGKDVQFGFVNGYLTAWRGARSIGFRPKALGYVDRSSGAWRKLADASFANVSRSGANYTATNVFPGVNLIVHIGERRTTKRYEIAVRPNFPDPVSFGMDPSTTYVAITYDVDNQTGVTPTVESTGLRFVNGTAVHSDLLMLDAQQHVILRLLAGQCGEANGEINNVFYVKTALVDFAEAVPYLTMYRARYPIWIDPTSTVYSGTEDGHIRDSVNVTTNSTGLKVGNEDDGCGGNDLYRAYVRFDLSAISGTCNSAVLSLYKSSKTGTQSCVAKLYNTDWGPTLAAADYNQAGSDQDTDAMDGAGYTAFDCNAAAIQGKFGAYASFELRGSNESPGAYNLILISPAEAAGTSTDPKIVVDYSESDVTDPTITITSPTSNPTYSTSNSTVDISGTASDNVGVTSVTWACDTGGSGTATGTTSWSVTGINLAEGDNVITVTAKDAALNEGTDSITVTYTAPVAPSGLVKGNMAGWRHDVFSIGSMKKVIRMEGAPGC